MWKAIEASRYAFFNRSYGLADVNVAVKLLIPKWLALDTKQMVEQCWSVEAVRHYDGTSTLPPSSSSRNQETKRLQPSRPPPNPHTRCRQVGRRARTSRLCPNQGISPPTRKNKMQLQLIYLQKRKKNKMHLLLIYLQKRKPPTHQSHQLQSQSREYRWSRTPVLRSSSMQLLLKGKGEQ